MARVCCVEGCDSLNKDDVTYFPFPVKQSLRRLWRAAVRVGKLTSDSLICSQHFGPGDYDTVRGKPRLRAKVVPMRTDCARRSPQHSENSNETTNGRTEPSSVDSQEVNSNDKEINEPLSNGSVDQETGEKDISKSVSTDQIEGETGSVDQKCGGDESLLGGETGLVDQKCGSNESQLGDETGTVDQECGGDKSQLGGETGTVDQECGGDKSQLGSETGTVDQECCGDESRIHEGGAEDETDKEIDNNHRKRKKKKRTDGRRNRKNGKKLKRDTEKDKIDQESGVKKELDQENGEKTALLDEYLNEEADFGVDKMITYGDSLDENGLEKCTIECVPEALLAPESSDSECEAHRGDIEDIIANYHIKQHKRLKAHHDHQEVTNQDSSKQESPQAPGGEALPPDKGKDTGDKDKDTGDSGDEVEFISSESTHKDPVFIAISVDQDPSSWQKEPEPEGDCLMVLEDVQVHIDPATVMPPSPECGGDVDSDSGEDDVEEVPIKKEDPISLLTSSDEDDVIVEEPKIDTVEVSDEDEDDVPLVKLVEPIRRRKNLAKILWGSNREFYCFQCHYKTLNKGEFDRHKKGHATIMYVCEICDFTCASKEQYTRHKKKHRDEKRFRCHLCDYKAKHRMSLIYHLKSHEGLTVETLKVDEAKKSFTCSKCKYHTDVKFLMMQHMGTCAGHRRISAKIYSCDKCAYETKRGSDLRRHQARKHASAKEETP